MAILRESPPLLRNATGRPARRSSSGPAAKCPATRLRSPSTPYAPTPTPTSPDPEPGTPLQFAIGHWQLAICHPGLVSRLLDPLADSRVLPLSSSTSLPRSAGRRPGWHPALHRLCHGQSDSGLRCYERRCHQTDHCASFAFGAGALAGRLTPL